MSVLDGFWFGVGRDIGVPLAVLVFVFALALAVEFYRQLRRVWWSVRGVKCGERHSRYPTCDLVRGHSGWHAGPVEKNERGTYRHRWTMLTHGEMSMYEYATPQAHDGGNG